MKKIVSLSLVLLIFIGVFCGCGSTAAPSDDGKLNIIVTVFPEYDWVMQVLGSKAESANVTLLLDNGVDLHSYQPTANDILKISKCDMFVYTGGESDGWVDDALKQKQNKNMVIVDLMEEMGDMTIEEKAVEGMQEEAEEGEESEEETEYDEHIWLSLKNAVKCAEILRDALIKVDGDGREAYEANAASYIEKLNELDNKYQRMVDSSTRKTLLFADRFPFAYLMKDYGIEYFAAFKGCSAESEASFETVSFLSKKVAELKLPYVLILEGGNEKLANTVIENSKEKSVEVLTVNSIQSQVTGSDTYLNIMEENLAAFKTALN